MTEGYETVGPYVARSHPLFYSFAKLERAVEQDKYLREDIARHLALFHAAPLPRHRDPKPGDGVWTWEKPIPPHTWSIRLGEFIHDLRSALDHAVWQLVLHDCIGPQPGRHTSFPVCTDETDFQSRALTVSRSGRLPALAGVKQRGRTVIENLQPYMTWKAIPRATPLYVLNELWNIDKHRMINVCHPIGKLAEVKAIPDGDYDGIWWRAAGPIEDGAELFRIPSRYLNTVNVEANIGLGIALDQTGDATPLRREIGRLISSLVNGTNDVIQALHPLFDRP